MDLNFKEALATVSRALPLVLLRAGAFIAGGFMVIVLFGMLAFASRLGRGASPVILIGFAMLFLCGGYFTGRKLQRFFLYRQQAAMLLLFSKFPLQTASLSAAIHEAERYFPDHSRWATLNRGLHLALSAFYRGGREFPVQPTMASSGYFSKTLDLLATWSISQAILALAFLRGHTDLGRSAKAALALYFQFGKESRRLAHQWLLLSAVSLVFLFLCLALPNWFFFKSAEAPVWIGIVLAAAIAWLLHRAFVIPFVLAGVSGALLAETSGKIPDPSLCEKLESLIPGKTLPGKRVE